MTRPLLLAILALLFLAAPLAAQDEEPAVRVGTRVRVTLSEQLWTLEGTRDPQVLRGVVRSLTRDSLRLQVHPGAAPVSVARSAVSRVDVSRGVPGRIESAAQGAILNAALFAASNLVIRAVDRDAYRSTEQAAARGAVVGGAFGALLGAAFPRERWQRARLPARARVTAGASRTGAALVAVVRF